MLPFTVREKGLDSFTIEPKEEQVGNILTDYSNMPLGLGMTDDIKQQIISTLTAKYLTYDPKTILRNKNFKLPEVQTDIELKEEVTTTKLLRRAFMQRDICTGKVTGFNHFLLRERNESGALAINERQEQVSRNSDFVRGSSKNMPFFPGGFEGDNVEPLNRQDEKELKTVPPGFDRGLFVSIGKKKKESSNLSKLFQVNDVVQEEADEKLVSETEKVEKSENTEMSELPLPSLNLIVRKSKAVKKESKQQTFAHMVDANSIPPDFDKVIPELAFKYPFELDPFQKQAVYHLEKGDSVFVAAHTSAGKTVVAEYAIALAAKHMTKAIYTSPIKALSNQKFRDFKNTFGDVGLLTGDIQLKPDASCLIMTTEILRSMLYRGADLIRDVEFVIFDEVHYVNDLERGVVWEEVIIMLPPHVSLILLSATIPNTFEFADWVGRTKQKDIYVVSTLKRPVPLEHFLFHANNLYKIVDAQKNFLADGYNSAMQAFKSAKTKEKDDRNLWTQILNLLKKKNLLPVVVFTFSKRRCEENVDSLGNVDLTTTSEKSVIHVFFEKSVAKLKENDRDLPQILRMRDLLSRGLAVHHSGLLPIMKEAVEIMFSKGLVRVLFATETFAMGVNMPARTVVFSSKRKHDGTGFRDLLPGEYTQMSGRAGRRGLDSTGVVILVAPEPPPESSLRTMLLGHPTKLESQFRLTYNMILNLLRVESLKVEDMIKRSFSENASQKDKPLQQTNLLEKETMLKNTTELECRICKLDLDEFWSFCQKFHAANQQIYSFLVDNRNTAKVFGIGRVVIVNNHLYKNSPGVITKVKQTEKLFTCVLLSKDDEILNDYFPLTSVNVGDKTYVVDIGVTDIVSATPLKIKIEENSNVNVISSTLREALKGLKSEEMFSLEIPKTKNFEIDSAIASRPSMIATLNSFRCVRCPDFNQHYGMHTQLKKLKEQMAELSLKVSDSNLTLLPEYHCRINVLKKIGFIDENSTVQIKGRVACEINTVDEIITTELIMDNAFKDYEPAEIVALLSCMVFQEKNASDPVLTPKLELGKQKIIEMTTTLVNIQKACGMQMDLESALKKMNFGLMQVVYEWARGVPFKQITSLTDVLEGSIVRTVVRLDETCREVRNAARMIGDLNLYKKIEIAGEAIKRDICFASSLYL